MMIEKGNPAPDFALVDETGTLRHLSEYRGSFVVLYFYPRDMTPGCTKEACGFRDHYSEYQAKHAVILGVSPDSAQSHVKFREKQSLPFSLLADPDHKVASLYGVWGLKHMMGKEKEGILRTTFLIDPVGIVKEVFEKVDPTIHSEQVLRIIDQ